MVKVTREAKKAIKYKTLKSMFLYYKPLYSYVKQNKYRLLYPFLSMSTQWLPAPSSSGLSQLAS